MRGICTEPNCGRESWARGLCHRCYMRHHRAKTLPPAPKRIPRTCSLCPRKHHGHGLCVGHLRRIQLFGSTMPNQPLKSPRRLWRKTA